MTLPSLIPFSLLTSLFPTSFPPPPSVLFSMFAGVSGTSGSTGDFGPATGALLNGPLGLAMDPAGRLNPSLFHFRMFTLLRMFKCYDSLPSSY